MPNHLSFSAIVVIAANTMNGPGLTTLPSMASSAGRLPYCALVVVAALSTCFVLKRLCDLLWRTNKPLPMDHDHATKQQMDLVELVGLVFPRHKPWAAVAMVGCALSLALAQMMLCAAIADAMLVAGLGQSCGLGFPQMHCTSTLSMKPFIQMDAIPVSLFSAGLALASSITIGLASVDLDSLLMAQYVLFGCLLVACARFAYTLHSQLQKVDPPLWSGTDFSARSFWGPNPCNAIGPVLFNFAFVVTAPPLCSGAETCQGATNALITSVILMAVLYMVVGTIGATAARYTTDDNLLSLVLRASNELQGMDVLAVALFGLSQLAAIPVYCELAKQTLQTHLHITNGAFFASHVLPWAVVALTYNSTLFEAFVEWSSLLLLGFANFSLPLLLDHHALAEGKWHTPGTGPDAVLWGLCVITASIAGVIVQRLTESMLLAEGTFMVTVLLILKYERDPASSSGRLHKSSEIGEGHLLVAKNSF